MALTQAEALRLLQLPKTFKPGVVSFDFSLTTAFDQEFELAAHGTAPERFLLDLERGRRKSLRLKFQTRAHRVYVLARLDLYGKPHRNPPLAPYRPGERFTGHHLHLYTEGFAGRVAYLPEEVPGFEVPVLPIDDVSWLVAFLAFCHVAPIPSIQTTL
jgi:hypothetical protein